MKLHVPVVKVPVETEGFEEGVQPVVKELPRSLKLVPVGDSSSHWHVYGEVPPLNEAMVVRVELWPVSMAPGLALMVGAARAGLTTTSWADEIVVSDFTCESSVTVAQYHVFVVRTGRSLNV
jgi:hypothetical protein